MSGCSLEFDPQAGLSAPETAAIRAWVASRFRDAFAEEGKPELNTDPSSPAGQLVDALTAEIEAKNAELLYLANQFNPKAASGVWQDALGHIYFLNRKLSEPTVVQCLLTGLPGTKIPYGAMAEDAEGRRFVHARTGVFLGADGKAETEFRATEAGPLDVGADTLARIVTAVPGWDTVSNPAPGVPGRLLETRGDFEARRAASVAKNAHGSVASLYGSLHDLSGTAGVIDVKVLENIGPDPVWKYGVEVPGHGVTVCIHGGADEEIARVIYEKKDAGCDTGGNTEVTYTEPEATGAVYRYRILRPDPVPFWVRVRLDGDGPPPEHLAKAIRQAVHDDFAGLGASGNPRAGLAQEIYASRFYCAVLELGARNLAEVAVALGPDPGEDDFGRKAEIRGDQEPVMAIDNVIVEGGA